MLDHETGTTWLTKYQATPNTCIDGPMHTLKDHSEGIMDNNMGWDFQLKVDAAFAPARDKYGVGFAIRDVLGQIYAAASIPVMEQISILGTELLAIQQGILFSVDTGHNQE